MNKQMRSLKKSSTQETESSNNRANDDSFISVFVSVLFKGNNLIFLESIDTACKNKFQDIYNFMDYFLRF